jgi:uncharacterized protein (TIGR02453 family)
MQISAGLLDFLRDLQRNNNKEWFHANKARYETEKKLLQQLVQHYIDQVGTFYNLEGVAPKDCTYRINRDVRFSANKAPYKNNMGFSLEEGGKKTGNAGFYLHIQPGNESFLASGAYAPSKEELAAIRQEIDYNGQELKNILENKSFKALFPKLEGQELKTSPKGYTQDNEHIQLLRKNQLYVWHKYSDKEILAPNFIETSIEHMKVLLPFALWINVAKSIEK